MISRKAPDLTRRAGNCGHSREEEEDDEERDEHAGRSIRASGGVYDIDDGVAGILRGGQFTLGSYVDLSRGLLTESTNASTSLMQKQKEMTMVMPRIPFRKMLHIIAFGN